MRLCPKCQSANTENARYCSQCGMPMALAELNRQTSMPATSATTGGPSAVPVLLIAGLIASAAFGGWLGSWIQYGRDMRWADKEMAAQRQVAERQIREARQGTSLAAPQRRSEAPASKDAPATQLPVAASSQDSSASLDEFIETDYVYDGIGGHLYAYIDPFCAWATFGEDLSGQGVARSDMNELARRESAGTAKWFFLNNHTKVKVVEAQTTYSSIVGVQVLPDQIIEDNHGKSIRADGKQLLYVPKQLVIRKGRFQTTDERLAFEAAQETEGRRMEIEADLNWEIVQRRQRNR